MTWASVVTEVLVLSGIALLALGASAYMALGEQDHPILRQLPWLGAFALAHGAHEFVRAVQVGRDCEAGYLANAAALLGVFSFAALFEFARRAGAKALEASAGATTRGHRVATRWIGSPWLTVALVVIVAAGAAGNPDPMSEATDIARLLLGMPAGLVAGACLWRAQDLQSAPRRILAAALVASALAVAVWGVAGLDRIPSTVSLDDRFLALFGVPVEVVRAVLAFAAAGALTVLVRRRALDRIRRLPNAQTVASRALDAAEHGIAIGAPDGRLLYVNPAFVRLWRLSSAADAIGRSATDFWMRPEEAAEVVAALYHTGYWAGPMEARTADGACVEVLVTGVMLRDAAGAPSGMLGSFVDTAAQRKVRRDSEHYRSFMDAVLATLPAVVVELSPDGKIRRVSSAFAKLIGWQSEELVGRDWFETCLPARDRPQIRALFGRAVSGTRTRGNVNAVLTRDGRERDIEWSDEVLLDEEGKPRSLLAVGLDVTDRLAEIRRSEASEARLKEAQALSRLGSWELDLRTQRLYWSDEIFRIFGRDPEGFEASYAAFLETVHPDDRELVDEAFTQSVAERRDYYLIHRLILPDGRLRWVEERAKTEYSSPDGAPVRSVGTVMDITDRVESERQLRASLEEKETLLREIHHRVKNNLQVIASLLHFQAKKMDDPRVLPVFLEARDRLRAMTLVHETLYEQGDLARIAFGTYLRVLASQLAKSFGAVARGIAVEVEAPADLQLPVDVAMPCGLLFTELLMNSCKYAFPPGTTGAVRLRVAAEPQAVVLTISDDGQGLPAGFDPATSGGFGWQLVRGITRQLDGELTLLEGPGTTVRVSFGFDPAEAEAEAEGRLGRPAGVQR